MTQSTRTVAQVSAAITSLEGMIADVDQFLRDLRNTPVAGDLVVVGYPSYGFYLNRSGSLSGIMGARLFDAFHGARVPTVTNGKGEVARVVTYSRAVDAAIFQQEDHRMNLSAMLDDLQAELADARAEAEHFDMLADQADYYDRLDREWTAAGRAFNWDGSDEAYEEYRDAKAERDADARQDR